MMKEMFYIVCSFALVAIGFSIPSGESIFAIIRSSLVRFVIYFLATAMIINNFELKKPKKVKK